MKKHLTSLQSTRPAQEISLISYDDRQMKLNYKNEIFKIFTHLSSLLTLRSYLLFRDIAQMFQNSENFFFKILTISTPEQLFAFAFPNKKTQDRIHQKEQIAFLVKLVLEFDNLRKAAANQGRSKEFETYKAAMELLEEKTPEYQKAIRQKKYNDKLQKKIKQNNEKEANFYKFEQAIKQNLNQKQKTLKTSFLQKIQHQNQTAYNEIEKTSARHMYKVRPSKLLSEAKDLSLRVKLSPYAAELKRDYDYKTLESNLSKTLDLDMSRKLSMISHMKRVEMEKINRDHKKRYSVMEQNFQEERNIAERELASERRMLENSMQIGVGKLQEKSARKEYDRVNSLQKSFNAYNLNSDSKEIRRILRNHKQTVQFSSQISQVADLRTSKDYLPLYGTLTNKMLQQQYVSNQTKRQVQHQKKIMRRFNVKNNPMKSIENEEESDKEADDMCGTKEIGGGKKMARERSLVALYDDDMNERK